MTGSLLLDILLVILLLSYAATGYRQGLLVSALSLLGFLGGGALGMWLLPTLVQSSQWLTDHEVLRIVVLVFGVFLLASVCQGVMVTAGRRARSRVRAEPLRVLDALFGSVAALVAVSILVWFVAGAVRGGAPAPLARAIGESQVLRTIDKAVPPATGQLFAGFRSMLDRNGFPRVFEGLAPEPIMPVAPPDAGTPSGASMQAASQSIVKITGLAQACQRGQEGSGWVLAPEQVVTNAHVVAGMSEAQVKVMGLGRSFFATVVVFDPQRDLAVLQVPGLPSPALPQGPDLQRGESAVVAGFPLDGPFRLDPARVRRIINATGSDIYGGAGVSREIYSLYARVEPGNSGGPLLSQSGQVVGVVFAKSLDDETTGYALTLDEARPVLDAARGARARVSTGGCSTG